MGAATRVDVALDTVTTVTETSAAGVVPVVAALKV
jgi:hypothetical protein